MVSGPKSDPYFGVLTNHNQSPGFEGPGKGCFHGASENMENMAPCSAATKGANVQCNMCLNEGHDI